MATTKIDFKLNSDGVRTLLRSSEMEADLRARAERIAAAAGPGHAVESQIGVNRARASVRTETFEAMREEATNRTLTRAIDAGRG